MRSLHNSLLVHKRAFSLLEVVCAVGFFALIAGAFAGLWGTLLHRVDNLRTRREAIHIAELFEVYAAFNFYKGHEEAAVQEVWRYDSTGSSSDFFKEKSTSKLEKGWFIKLIPIEATKLSLAPMYELKVLNKNTSFLEVLYAPAAFTQRL